MFVACFFAALAWNPPSNRAAAAAPSPPETNFLPVAAGAGVVVLLVLSALAWYIPIALGWKKREN